MKVKLASACYEVLQAETGQTALDIARAEVPDLILLDVLLPDLDGFTVCAALKADPETAHIPVVMVTALADTAARLKGLKAGADDFLSKPLAQEALLARVRNLLRQEGPLGDRGMQNRTRTALGRRKSDTGPDAMLDAGVGHIGLVCISPSNALLLGQALQRRLPTDRFTSYTWQRALEAKRHTPDVFLIEAATTDPWAALRLMAELRARPVTRNAGMVILLPAGQDHMLPQALDQGAHDVLVQPVSAEELALRLRSQVKRNWQAKRVREDLAAGLELALIDPLTGLFNRRYALNQLDDIATRAAETGTDFAVLMLDVDHFKHINDRYGHAGGDRVLAELARRLCCNLRAMDLIARIGGEEFLIALPETDAHHAAYTAERLRQLIEDQPISLNDGRQVAVTVSLGMTLAGSAQQRVGRNQGGAKTRLEGRLSTDILIDQADRALYAAKAQGRNKVSVASGQTAA